MQFRISFARSFRWLRLCLFFVAVSFCFDTCVRGAFPPFACETGTLIDYSGLNTSNGWFAAMVNGVGSADEVFARMQPHASVHSDGSLFYVGESPLNSDASGNAFGRRVQYGYFNTSAVRTGTGYWAKTNYDGSWTANAGPHLDDSAQVDLFNSSISQMLSSRTPALGRGCWFLTPLRWCSNTAGRPQYVTCSTCGGSGKVNCASCGGTGTRWYTCPNCGTGPKYWQAGTEGQCTYGAYTAQGCWSSCTMWYGGIKVAEGWIFRSCTHGIFNKHWWFNQDTYTCPRCEGTTRLPCFYCQHNWNGWAYGKNARCDGGCDTSGKKTCAACGGSGSVYSHTPPDEEGLSLDAHKHTLLPVRQMCANFTSTSDSDNWNTARTWTFWSYDPFLTEVQTCRDYLALTKWDNPGIHTINNYASFNFGWWWGRYIYYRQSAPRVCFDSQGNAHFLANRLIHAGGGYLHNVGYLVYTKFNSAGTKVDEKSFYQNDPIYRHTQDLQILEKNGQTIPLILYINNGLSSGWDPSRWVYLNHYGVTLFSINSSGQLVSPSHTNCLGLIGTDPSATTGYSYQFKTYGDYLIFAICIPPSVMLAYGTYRVNADNSVQLLSNIRYETNGPSGYKGIINDCGRIISMDIKNGHLWITYMNTNNRVFKCWHAHVPNILK